MRGKRLAANTILSLLLQVTTIVCGFVLPRLILQYYGSEVNGLISSISQFLNIITFLELGVGAVVMSALYKPLADKDKQLTSEIIVSASNFFRSIGKALLVYVVVLILLYPYIAKSNFDHLYTAVLIIAMSVSYFAQYYFGIVDNLLMTADQKGYIQYAMQIGTILLNTILCVVVIRMGFSIQMVKLTTSVVYLIRPFAMRIYVNTHYDIDRKIKLSEEPIKQKWNGIAQHVSAVILNGTDSVVLTIFSTLSNVSIYSVYHYVVYGVSNLFTSMINGGIQSLLGELWAKDEKEKLDDVFKWTEWSIHTFGTFLFTCTGLLIIPFVIIYTSGIKDANYYQPVFATLIVIANAVYCLRLPYHVMIKAAGKYKETQSCYIVSTILNVVVSIIVVKNYGLVGIAIGTLVGMLYQTIWMAVYIYKGLLNSSLTHFLKQVIVDLIGAVLSCTAVFIFKIEQFTYFSWVKLAIAISIYTFIIMLFVNFIFYRKMEVVLFNKIFARFRGDK